MDKYIRGKVLGKGSFGCAILVTNKLDNKNYVIKEIDISRMPKAERDASEQEAKVKAAAHVRAAFRLVNAKRQSPALVLNRGCCCEREAWQTVGGHSVHRDCVGQFALLPGLSPHPAPSHWHRVWWHSA